MTLDFVLSNNITTGPRLTFKTINGTLPSSFLMKNILVGKQQFLQLKSHDPCSEPYSLCFLSLCTDISACCNKTVTNVDALTPSCSSKDMPLWSVGFEWHNIKKRNEGRETVKRWKRGGRNKGLRGRWNLQKEACVGMKGNEKWAGAVRFIKAETKPERTSESRRVKKSNVWHYGHQWKESRRRDEERGTCEEDWGNINCHSF